MLVAYLTGAVGLLVLVVVLLVVHVRFRRFSAAADAYRSRLARGAAALPALRGRRRVNY